MRFDPILLRATDDSLLYMNINESGSETHIRKGAIVLYFGPISEHEALFLHEGIVHFDLISMRYSVFEEF